MSEVERDLARISRARIFYHNGPGSILTSYLDLEYARLGAKIGGTGQGFGGRVLGGSYTHEWITGVMECLDVDDWRQVAGKYVWADHTHDKVFRIHSVVTGKTFDPSLWDEQ